METSITLNLSELEFYISTTSSPSIEIYKTIEAGRGYNRDTRRVLEIKIKFSKSEGDDFWGTYRIKQGILDQRNTSLAGFHKFINSKTLIILERKHKMRLKEFLMGVLQKAISGNITAIVAKCETNDISAGTSPEEMKSLVKLDPEIWFDELNEQLRSVEQTFSTRHMLDLINLVKEMYPDVRE